MAGFIIAQLTCSLKEINLMRNSLRVAIPAAMWCEITLQGYITNKMAIQRKHEMFMSNQLGRDGAAGVIGINER